MGVFGRVIEGLASESTEQKTVMIEATYLQAHRTASSLQAQKRGPTTSAGAWLGGCEGEDEMIRGINSPRSGVG
jgi:hypothetical protein